MFGHVFGHVFGSDLVVDGGMKSDSTMNQQCVCVSRWITWFGARILAVNCNKELRRMFLIWFQDLVARNREIMRLSWFIIVIIPTIYRNDDKFKARFGHNICLMQFKQCLNVFCRLSCCLEITLPIDSYESKWLLLDHPFVSKRLFQFAVPFKDIKNPFTLDYIPKGYDKLEFRLETKGWSRIT